MLILRAADRADTPWKNAQGFTREIAVYPQNATLDTFDWRVSMANIHKEGPFSTFPNIDRKLAVLSGRLSLTLGDDFTIEVEPGDPPISFHGETPAYARLPNGPVSDLNLMTRRNHFQVSFDRVEMNEPMEINGSGTLILLTETADLSISSEGKDFYLSALDAIMIEDGLTGAVRLQPRGATVVHIIRLARRATVKAAAPGAADHSASRASAVNLSPRQLECLHRIACGETSAQIIGHVERGETNLSIDNLERLADALKIPAAELLIAKAEGSYPPAGS